MRRRWLIAALALFAALVLVLPTAANARLKPLFAVMSGPNVEPKPGDEDGGGSFTAVIDGQVFCYGIALKDLRPWIVVPYTAHVHEGAANTSGPRVIRLDAPWSVDPGSSSGCVRLDEELALAIPENPGGYYVDVHSFEFPFGAARGQIFAVDP